MPQPQDVQLPGKSIYDMLFERYPFVTPGAQQKIRETPLRIAPMEIPLPIIGPMLGVGSKVRAGPIGASKYNAAKNEVRVLRPYNRQEFIDSPALLDQLMHEFTHAYDYGWQPYNLPDPVGPTSMGLFSPVTSLLTSLGAGPTSARMDVWPRTLFDERTRELSANYGSRAGIDKLVGYAPREVLAQTASVWGPDLITKMPDWMRPAMSGLYDFSWKPPAQTAVQPASAYPSDYRLGR